MARGLYEKNMLSGVFGMSMNGIQAILIGSYFGWSGIWMSGHLTFV